MSDQCPCKTAESREAAMVVLDPTPLPGVHKGVWCDPCIAPLVKALNDGGLPTVASCCGHGKREGSIALADGRWLVVATQDQFDRISHMFHRDAVGAAVLAIAGDDLAYFRAEKPDADS